MTVPVISATPQPAAFLAPRNIPRSAADNNLSPAATGGAGLNDASQGLASQIWQGSYSAGSITLTPQVGTPITFAVDFVVWFDFCFDQSMNPIIAWALNDGTTYFRWFDSTVPGYVVTPLPFGTDPWPFCSLDDSRASQTSNSDVIVSYTIGGRLKALVQRERFATVHDLGAVPSPKILVQAGISVTNRYQWEFAALLPALLSLQGKFVDSEVFLAVMVPNVGNIRPRVYMPQEDVTIRTRNK